MHTRWFGFSAVGAELQFLKKKTGFLIYFLNCFQFRELGMLMGVHFRSPFCATSEVSLISNNAMDSYT